MPQSSSTPHPGRADESAACSHRDRGFTDAKGSRSSPAFTPLSIAWRWVTEAAAGTRCYLPNRKPRNVHALAFSAERSVSTFVASVTAAASNQRGFSQPFPPVVISECRRAWFLCPPMLPPQPVRNRDGRSCRRSPACLPRPHMLYCSICCPPPPDRCKRDARTFLLRRP